jgi:integrase
MKEMARIRGKNEGSIHERKNGTWRAQVSLEGRRLSFTAKTRRECQEWLKKTISQVDNGISYASTTVILGEYLKSWLEGVKASKRHNTWLSYEQLSRSYVIPQLGKMKLKDLRPDHIQTFYNQLRAKEVGAYVIIKIHVMLHSALEQAVKVGYASRNVTDAAVPPRPPTEEMKVLEESQVSQLLVAAKDTRMDALLHLAVATGLRQMELLGLKWTDLDWSKRTLKVERQLERANSEHVRFTQPKTHYGRRLLALGKQTVAGLREQYDRQNDERKMAGNNWKEFGLIFPSKVGTPINYRNLLRDFQILLQKAGLPQMRFHDLRHTAASIMLNHGVPVIVVSRRLGHARPSITLDIYGHLLPSMQEEVAQLIDEWITPVAINTLDQLHPSAPNCTRSAPDLLHGHDV